MILFYSNEISGEEARFSSEEARHIGQVLRKRIGEPVHFVDGLGGWYQAEIERLDRTGGQARILEKKILEKRPFNLHLAVAPPKQAARMEWLLEKVTEIGIEEISLLQCSRSERQRVKMDRWERILQSAMKQSLQAYLPRLHGLQPFDAFIREERPGHRYIGWCEATEKQELRNNLQAGTDVTVVIGPEGDFTPEEIELARNCGYQPISLGPNRLRTETAGLVACLTVNLFNS